jgi:hypothetical protein
VDHKAVDVSWSSPGGGNVFNVYLVGVDGILRSWKSGVGAGRATFHGAAGGTYWFWATVTTDLGWKDAGGSQVIRLQSPKGPIAT